eukprot:gnl/MRDRNA2_/MRDRNA2_86729_c0_seq6.p1 gnl/MRDRNA2_/MRDRNA2_86729_c0~~gnl/MRDRNA2_/MRDRNA2_86729_c0_seq6.p1  ORF type:complete len:118 (-),score=8.58 gnl/MRDRNA2_/MRDRNA2_86729_c0_seq6:134-487(-)
MKYIFEKSHEHRTEGTRISPSVCQVATLILAHAWADKGACNNYKSCLLQQWNNAGSFQTGQVFNVEHKALQHITSDKVAHCQFSHWVLSRKITLHFVCNIPRQATIYAQQWKKNKCL